MPGFIVCFLVGTLCVAIGISNVCGNISTIHSYHRNRVSEDNRRAFGKGVGIGMIVCGGGVIAFSALLLVTLYTEIEIFTLIGTGVMLVALAVGLVISLLTIKKYNHGIF